MRLAIASSAPYYRSVSQSKKSTKFKFLSIWHKFPLRQCSTLKVVLGKFHSQKHRCRLQPHTLTNFKKAPGKQHHNNH